MWRQPGPTLAVSIHTRPGDYWGQVGGSCLQRVIQFLPILEAPWPMCKSSSKRMSSLICFKAVAVKMRCSGTLAWQQYLHQWANVKFCLRFPRPTTFGSSKLSEISLFALPSGNVLKVYKGTWILHAMLCSSGWVLQLYLSALELLGLIF